MNEINIYIEKLINNTFGSSDIPLIMKVLHQDAKSGLIELTKSDTSLFQIYTFALQQLELVNGTASSSVHAGDWRETVDDLSTLKHFIDSLENNKIITNVSWNAGGMAFYDIPDRNCYKAHICAMIHAHLKKLY